MKKLMNSLLQIAAAVIIALFLSGCAEYLDEILDESFAAESAVSLSETREAATEILPQTSETEPNETTTAIETEQSETTEETAQQTSETSLTETTKQEAASTEQTTAKSEVTAPPETTAARTEKTIVTETTVEKLSVEKDGSYTTPEDVAEYIHTFGTLPKNFITKDEAKALGWDNKKGNLWDVAEGKSIGGDYFGNYEGLLPKAKGRKYTECDVNYEGGYRGSERIIFSNDGLIYYTNDHYQTFTQLY